MAITISSVGEAAATAATMVPRISSNSRGLKPLSRPRQQGLAAGLTALTKPSEGGLLRGSPSCKYLSVRRLHLFHPLLPQHGNEVSSLCA